MIFFILRGLVFQIMLEFDQGGLTTQNSKVQMSELPVGKKE